MMAGLRALRRWLVLGLSLALTAITLYFVLRGVEAQSLRRLLTTQNRGLLIAAAAFVLLQNLIAGERWRAILQVSSPGRTPSIGSVQAVFYASLFFNNLPLGAIGGDVVRVWLARRFAFPVTRLMISVLFDRVVTVLALIVLAVLSLPAIAAPVILAVWVGAVAVLIATIAGILLLGPVERMLGRWRKRRVVHVLLRTVHEFRILGQPGGLIALFWALLSTLASAAAAYSIARSLDIEVPPLAVVAVISIVALLVALPISLAGWGIREVSVVAMLGLLGINRDAALLFSVEFGLLSMLMSLPGGVIWFALPEPAAIALSAKIGQPNVNPAPVPPDDGGV
jgi:hypothetical protein